MARMSVHKQSIISILSILLYSIGFFRIEVELNNHMRKIFALEEAVHAIEKSIRNGSPEGTITLPLIVTFEITQLKLRNLPLLTKSCKLNSR